MSFQNKLITITGAASGIGLSTARILAQRGAFLSLADNSPSLLSTAHKSLVSLTTPTKILSTPLDIRSTSSVDAWIASTIQHFDHPIDGCANIAGFHPLWTPKNIQDITDEGFEDVVNVNALGTFKCLRAQLREGIISEKGGSIVNVGSVSGLIGFKGDAAYVASKHAVHGLTKCAAKEVGTRNIRVNTVAPGQTNTPMVHALAAGNGTCPTPDVSLEREGEPDEVAKVIVWLLGDEASYVTGSVYRVDGGMLE